MPLNPPTLAAGFIAPNLISVAHLGVGMPKLALGVSVGVCQYLTLQAKVISTDVGTLGVGTTLFPLLVPLPLLQTSLLAGFAGAGILGTMAPLTITGLSNGLMTGLGATALLQITHPTVGAGSGVAKIVGGSAVPAMLQGFASVGMTGDGPTKMARAIGTALDSTFASLVVPVPIVGPSAPSGSSGVGFGFVI